MIGNMCNCTGCTACYSICPQNAIKMQLYSEGFCFPEIDKEKCINCNLCSKVCPVDKKSKQLQKKSYAVINNNEKERMESSSGGMFSLLANYILEKNGVVFGVKINSSLSSEFAYITEKDKLNEFRGSKYVQADMGNSYKKCKEFLEANRQVLFTGTPCQIAGLKSFLMRDYENLLCIDFVCHGIPSKKLLNKYVDFEESKKGKKITSICFRDKTTGWANYSVKELFEDGSFELVEHKKHPYMQLYLSNSCYRESCYSCNFKADNTFADITIGDYWGIKNCLSEFYDDKGTSLVIANNDKGLKVISCLNDVKLKETIFSDLKILNKSLFNSTVRPNRRTGVYSDLDNMTFRKFYKRYRIAQNKFHLFVKKIIKKVIC